MSEKALLWLLIGMVAIDLYIDYRVAMGLQEGSDKVKTAINDPLGALGLR